MVELTVSPKVKFIVDPKIVETVKVDPDSVEKNPLFKNIDEAVTVEVAIEEPFIVE